MNKKKERFVTRYKFEYFWGERYIVYVRFPSSMTVDAIVEELFWAKTWKIERFYDEVIVRAIVKPYELERFLEVNKKRLLKFKVDERIGSIIQVKTDKNETTIFEL
jgi:hypothetical protein